MNAGKNNVLGSMLVGFKRLKEHGRKWEKVTDAKVGGVIQRKC